MEDFLVTTYQNVRSSKRTDVLHQVVLELMKNADPMLIQLNYICEYTLEKDGFGGTFKIDIVGVDHKGYVKIAILDKAYNSCVNKNIKNAANTTMGEAARLMFSPIGAHIEKIVFVSIMPRKAPVFDNQGLVTHIDDVIQAKHRTQIDKVLQQQYNGKVVTIDLFYDIDDIQQKKSKTEFQDITVSNITQMPSIYAENHIIQQDEK